MGEPVVWPRDRNRIVSRIQSRNVTLGELMDHVDRYIQKDFSKKPADLIINPRFQRTKLLLQWTRQYTTLLALRQEAKNRGVDDKRIETKRKIRAHEEFEKYLKLYLDNYKKRTGRNYPATDKQVADRRADFLFENGFKVQIEALVDAILPDYFSKEQVDRIYKRNSWAFTGYLNIAHIFVQTRNPQTGALLAGKRGETVSAKVAKIRELLREDGSNFEDVAGLHTEAKPVLLRNLPRLNNRLDPIISRVAWSLKDGGIAGPVESRYGVHFVKRINFHAKTMITNLDHKTKQVQDYVRALSRDNLIYGSWRTQRVEWIY